MNKQRRQLAVEERSHLEEELRRVLGARGEILFAVLHGSYVEGAFRDVDVAVGVDARVGRLDGPDYEAHLAALLERAVRQPVDVRVVNFAPLGFRQAVTSGRLLVARDSEAWFTFRERTWTEYFDFAPVAREALADLLRPRS